MSPPLPRMGVGLPKALPAELQEPFCPFSTPQFTRFPCRRSPAGSGSAILGGMKFLAVDFGERRIGLATSDASGSLVTPRQTITRKSDAAAVAEIAEFARREEVEAVVLGLPHHADGTENELAPRVRSFGARLASELALPTTFADEHLTSREAASRFPRSVTLDAAAAAVLLEAYLTERRR